MLKQQTILNHDGTVLNVKNVIINSKCDICHISKEIAGHIQTHCDAFYTGGVLVQTFCACINKFSNSNIKFTFSHT